MAFAVTDSVTYTVHGRVSDSITNASIRNTDVVVSISFGSELLHEDTVRTNNQGNYTTTSPRVAYQDGDNTITVTVSATGYGETTREVSVATSTTDITVDILLQATTVVNRIAVPARGVAAGTATLYSVSGRLIGRMDSRQAEQYLRTRGMQSAIMVMPGEAARTLVPAR